MADDSIATGYPASEGAGGAGAVVFNNDDLLNLQEKNMKFAADEQDKAIALQEKYQQKNQDFLKSLDPDLKGIFPGDRDYIQQQAMKLHQLGVGYIAQRKNPEMQGDVQNSRSALEGLVDASRSRQLAAFQAIKTLDENPDKFNQEDSHKKIATLLGTPLPSLGADAFQQLLVPKPPDLLKTGLELVDKIPYKATTPGTTKNIAGRTFLEQDNERDPAAVIATADALYNSNPNAVQAMFDNAPKTETAGFKVAAAASGGIAAKMYYTHLLQAAAGGKDVTYIDGSYGDPQRFEWTKFKDQQEKDVDPTIQKSYSIALGRPQADDIVVKQQAIANTSIPGVSEPGTAPQLNAADVVNADMRINMTSSGRSRGTFQISQPVYQKQDPSNPGSPDLQVTTKDAAGNEVPLTKPSTMENIHYMYANMGGVQYAMNTKSLYDYAQKRGMDFDKVIANPNLYKADVEAYEKVGQDYPMGFENGLKGEEGTARMKVVVNTVRKLGAFEKNGTINAQKMAGEEEKPTEEMGGYKIGQVQGGYKYMGGDPAKQESWVKQ